ncbi:hypothetical protein AVEN_129863-1 [Araneus ventricosus]|uniref:Uncharacterized protein n=1 Tax=Araneus ventricosus TaxID=182803 RepID=A0A4Y2TB39_ARAVE|nr:hypothetical protein AVEN_129863-1 [Araneus ventricosus]
MMARHRNGGKLFCIQNKGSVLPLQYKNIKVRFTLGNTGTVHVAEIYEGVYGVTLGVNFTFVFDRLRHLVVELHIDYLREPKTKCFLSQELLDVVFENSRATNIAAALEEARLVFENARPNVNKVSIISLNFLSTYKVKHLFQCLTCRNCELILNNSNS